MKLVKKGVAKKPWKGTCRQCGNVYSAPEAELKVTNDQREGSFGEAECENCGTRIVFYPPVAANQFGM